MPYFKKIGTIDRSVYWFDDADVGEMADPAIYEAITDDAAASLLAPPQSLEEANTAKYAEILAGANAMDAAIKARYSTPEIASFEQQRQGAEAIIAAPDITGTHGSPVALVRGLAAAEGVSATAFAERILYNVAQASAAMEAILLQQRAYEATLKRAATVEEVEAITVKYTLG